MEEAAKNVVSASLWLLAAYAYVRLSYYRRFRVEHLERDRFALHLVAFSAAFYVAGQVAAALAPNYILPPFADSLRKNLASIGITIPVLSSITIGVLFAGAENAVVAARMWRDARRIDDRWWWVRTRCRLAAVSLFIRRSDDAILKTVFRAAVLKKSILVTLKSHKVYVGKPYFPLLDDPTTDLRSLKLLVSRSGYRNKDTKVVNLLTDYRVLKSRVVEFEPDGSEASSGSNDDLLRTDEVILLGSNGEPECWIDLEDLGTAISWSEVESIKIFDAQIYDVFQEKHQAGGQPQPEGSH